MRDDIKDHRETFQQMYEGVCASVSNGAPLLLEEALEKAMILILERSRHGGKLIFIGNGGSSAIASHMATDFWKNAGIKAMTFNDSTILTCLSNDYGYKHVFEKSIEMFAEPDDILIAISSSGNSENILRGVFAAQEKKLGILTFSGFKEDNLLRGKGDVNFYVPIQHYGHVEVIHHALCHCLIDVIIKQKSKQSTDVLEGIKP